MATIGQSLLQPESGWKRYEQDNQNISYVGAYSTITHAVHSGGNCYSSNVNGFTVKFNFISDKIRFIAQTYNTFTDDISVYVDGELVGKTSQYSPTQVNQALYYEKTDLALKEHSIEIINNTAKLMIVDAFDINQDGQLLPFKLIQKYKRLALKNPTTNQNYSLAEKTLISLPDSSNENMILFGIEQGKEIQLDVPFDKIKTIVDNGDGTQTITDETVEPFSVYDYISETPEVIVYTESTDDITVSTITDPFDIYDEFGDSVEVLYYTDDETATEADLVLEAKWSPIDELEGDFEVVTWTDEDKTTAQRTLELSSIPTPKFVYSNNTVETYNELLDIISDDLSTYYNKSKVRYLLTPNNLEWYTYQNGNFIVLSDMSDASILEHGITFDTLKDMAEDDYSKWNFDTVNVGVYLEDGIRDNITSSITPIETSINIPKHTPKIEDASFYILNTTAQINLDFNGLTLSGVLSDADMTRVQYRVNLNGIPYYPADGSFTPLSAPPENILITLDSDDVIINDWNDLEVEFQDFFGTTDTWSIRFIGKYAGIMFMDELGEYYSTDMGKVLQYLDFGEVLTGQVTPSYPIKIKNEYGFPIKDTKIMVNNSSFAEGLKVEFQLSEGARDFEEELLLGSFANNEEKTFYINMRSPITTVPNGNDKFDIYVVATRDV